MLSNFKKRICDSRPGDPKIASETKQKNAHVGSRLAFSSHFRSSSSISSGPFSHSDACARDSAWRQFWRRSKNQHEIPARWKQVTRQETRTSDEQQRAKTSRVNNQAHRQRQTVPRPKSRPGGDGTHATQGIDRIVDNRRGGTNSKTIHSEQRAHDQAPPTSRPYAYQQQTKGATTPLAFNVRHQRQTNGSFPVSSFRASQHGGRHCCRTTWVAYAPSSRTASPYTGKGLPCLQAMTGLQKHLVPDFSRPIFVGKKEKNAVAARLLFLPVLPEFPLPW